MVKLIEKVIKGLPKERIWGNADGGLKARHWEETRLALANMVAAVEEPRKTYVGQGVTGSF